MEGSVTGRVGDPVPTGTLGPGYVGGHTLRSDPLDVRVLRLVTLGPVPDVGHFDTPTSTDLGTPGLGVGSH